ncbi:hypothetical protein V474_17975 [Novosphingobium barchaimii LL02]|uniref:DUF1090 domain-containing protein n=1 Tax=Novosphingobium barchaimii LL02 TaxID=1114963 RepID=A0A0J7XV41_9SPHN|nr:DUF1090 domain-containing protein [Novosphingobium barchaimii]KMS54958.1 hypothetical protein V474_17975 [Novosphingobium barchaimii LL02]
MRIGIFGALALLASSPVLAAEPSPLCVAKQQDIERRIFTAKTQGHSRELDGLNKALRESRRNCTAASLEAERARDIRQASEEVAEREAALAKARRGGDPDKIAKREAKLQEARVKLAEAELPLGT